MVCTSEDVCDCGYECVSMRGRVSKYMFLDFNEKNSPLSRNSVLFILLTTGQLDNG